MNFLSGAFLSLLLMLGVVQPTPVPEEPTLGADSTLSRLELWTATTSPYTALTPRTYGKSLYLPTASVTATYGYFTNLFVDTCTGAGCGSAGGGGTDGNWVTNNTSAFLRTTTTTYDVLIGGSTTNSAAFVFDVSGLSSRLTLSNLTATGTLDVTGVSTFGTATGTQANFNAAAIGVLTYGTATGSTLTGTLLNFSTATGSNVNALSATFATATVSGLGVCLSNGVNCPAAAAGGSQTLAQVTALGASATPTLQLLGGFLAASSTVTSSFYVVGATTLTNATATTLFTTSLRGTSSTIGTMAATSLFADQVTSTALFATSFKATSSTIATLAAGTLFFGNATGTNLFATVVSSTSLFASMGTLGGLMVSGTTVCLSNGVGCLAASASAAGIVELATIGETSAGSDATRAVTPDGLAGSVFGSKTVELYLNTSSGAFLAVNSVTNTSTCFTVQPPLAGMVLTAAHVAHGVAGSGTTSTVVNIQTTSSLFLLSTPLYIDPGEYGSETAVTSSVINTSNDDVYAYERLCALVQNVENTTPGKETIMSMTFTLP